MASSESGGRPGILRPISQSIRSVLRIGGGGRLIRPTQHKERGPRPGREPFFKTDELVYDTLSAIIARVNSTKVSTNTRPRIMAARIGPEAPGLRAMPSQAADAMRP